MVEAVMEIGPLLVAEWTGIPSVAAGLAEAALHDPEIDWSFMIDTIELPRPLVEHMLAWRSGAAALAAFATLAWEQGEIPRARADRAAGLFTNMKPVRGFFAREAMILYDFSPILTPRFHDESGIAYFADHIRGDIATSDHFFCISRATRDDARAYFDIAPDRLSLIEPGVTFDPVSLSAARLAPHGLGCEPYVAIIGTLEPRKNGRVVLEHLARDPAFAARYRIVFVGRDGWLDEKARLMTMLADAGVDPGRVIFTGFLTEREKTALILNASFCLYPSVFEGYGLPVLEAAALGRLTVCSNFSSLPEVAPESSLFFDPADPDSLAAAIARAEQAIVDAPPIAALGDLIAQTARVSPARTYPPIARWVHGR